MSVSSEDAAHAATDAGQPYVASEAGLDAADYPADPLENCLVALLHEAQLHQHGDSSWPTTSTRSTARQQARWNTTTGATVAQLPDPM